MGSRRQLMAVLVLVVPLALSSLFPKTIAAQTIEVTGRVIAASDSLPRGGVSVRVKGGDTGVLSNSSGEYRINVPSLADTLVFSYLGFAPLEVPIAEGGILDVALAPSVNPMEPVVVIRYNRNAPPPASCAQAFSPMPGSAYDPNWQRENPELARLMAPQCSPTAPRYEVIPPAPEVD